MCRSVVRCGVIGGVIAFLWMMASWMILPQQVADVHAFAEESEVLSTIARYAPKDGIYIIPRAKQFKIDGKDQSFVFVNIRRGIDIREVAQPLAWGFLTQIAAAGLATYLLLKAKPLIYWGRVRFVTLAAVFAVLLGTIPSWNGWHFPALWVVLGAADIVAGWFLAAMVIAKLVKN